MKNSVYCSVCDGCGEDGCCPATCCQQSPEGSYCATYLADLKYTYWMFKDCWKLMEKAGITETEEYKKIFEENYKLAYGE